MTDLHEDIHEQDLKIFFKASKRTQIKKIILTIEGAFTIQNIERISEAIIPLFSTYDYVDISMKNMDAIDLTAIQLLYVLKKIYEPDGKKISLISAFSAEDEKLLSGAGFYQTATKSILL